jgi:hypothetical protein
VLEQASQLRAINIKAWAVTMTEEEKMCFAINLYHALRLHARYLIGQPQTLLGWALFNSRTCYAVGCGADAIVLSLAELEHCVLRKPMSPPRTIISTHYQGTPSTRALELKRKEPRLNFAINYGTLSSPSKLLVFYSPTLIDKTFDIAAASFLEECLAVDAAKGVIGVPQILYWYARDLLADHKDLGAKQVSRALVDFMSDAQRARLQVLLQAPDLVYKVVSFKWRAQPRQTELQWSER